MSTVAGIPQDHNHHHPHHHTDRGLLNKPFHRRNGSGELDVFEAARYFSGYNEAAASSYNNNNNNNNGSSFTQKGAKEESRSWPRGGRISLDMPIRHVLNPHHQQQQASNMDHKQIGIKVDKKYKQPSSPGGRLASFLNSLFNQSTSKTKKKSKPSSSSSSQSMKDEFEESPGGGRRKRRSSISHFHSTNTTTTTNTTDSKSMYSSSSSGFRTPPPYAQTPTKSYKDFKTFTKQKSAATINHDDHKKLGINTSIGAISDQKEKIWVAVEKYPLSSSSSSSSGNNRKQRLGLFRRVDEESINGRDDDGDDGADSDSSSDLFELQNYDLSSYSNGLPVYETTNVDNIKRGSPIPTASM